jgi:3-oxoacyl-[acyl-carrier protein] reductase
MITDSQRVAIVTGGTRGIGRTVATRLVADGYAVVVNYAANKAAADDVVAELSANGGAVIAVRADVADEAAVAALFDSAERKFGGIDVVVHAAAVVHRAPIVDLDLEKLDQVLRTNIRGTFVVDQQAARRIRPGGALINFASCVTKFSTPNNSAYTASKGAVESITLLLARELRGRDISVNAVAPGSIDTEMLEEYLAGDDELRERIAAQSPFDRLGTPQDITEVVAFLAGPARWINGQVIYANGGAI